MGAAAAVVVAAISVLCYCLPWQSLCWTAVVPLTKLLHWGKCNCKYFSIFLPFFLDFKQAKMIEINNYLITSQIVETTTKKNFLSSITLNLSSVSYSFSTFSTTNLFRCIFDCSAFCFFTVLCGSI